MKSMLAICLTSVIASLGSVAPAAAQDDGLNDKGLHGNRDYFSRFPFEHIDAATGALILTFTDLVLPGVKGRDLRFQRTYNSKDHKWTFGLAGYALYIYEPGFPPKGGSPEGYSPTLYTADGGEHRTTSMQPVDMTDETSIANTYCATTTDRLWRVQRDVIGKGAWGGNMGAQLGVVGSARETPISVPGLTNPTSVTAGSDVSYTVLGDGTVRIWGLIPDGLIPGVSGVTPTPTPVPGLTGIKAVVTGVTTSYALGHDGRVWGVGGQHVWTAG